MREQKTPSDIVNDLIPWMSLATSITALVFAIIR